MIRPPLRHTTKWCFVGLCFVLLISISEFPYPSIRDKAHASSKAPLVEALSWLSAMGQRIGLSSLEFEVHGVSLQVSEILAHVGQFLPPAVRDWKPSGETVFDLDVAGLTSQESGEMVLNLDLRLKNGAFSSPEATITGDHVEGKIHISLNVSGLSDQPTVIQADLALEAGEIVLGNFHFDFRKDPLHLHLLGSYDAQNHRFPSLSVRFDAPTLGQGTITATLENLDDPRGEVQLAFGPISNKRAFDLFVREAFGHLSPVVKELLIDGKTFVTARIRGSSRRYSVQGRLDTSVADLVIPTHRIAAQGVRVRFPFAMEFPNPERSVSPIGLNASTSGHIHVERIRWRSQQWRDLAVPVAFARNVLVMGAMEIPVWGGTVMLDGAKIQDPFGKAREILLGLRLDQIDFSRVTEALTPLSLPGSVEGNFSEIRISRERLAAHGSLTIRALGGQIEVHNIRGTTPFSPLQKVSMGVRLTDVYLEESLVGSLLPATLLNWRLSGTTALDLAVGERTPYTTRLDFASQLDHVSFSSPDETELGENVEGEIHISLNIPVQRDRPVSFDGNLNLRAGEILFGPFYLNLQQDPLRLGTIGTYDPESRRLFSLAVRFDAPTFGQGTITASMENLDDPRGEVEVALGPISNDRAFHLFVKQPFGHVSPVLNELSIDGETFITALFRGSPRAYSVRGLLETSHMDLAIPPHQIKAKGLKVQLPFALNYPDVGRTAEHSGLDNAMAGSVRSQWIQWKSQEWQNITVPLILKENTLFLPPRMELPLWGGTMILERAEIQDPFGKARKIRLGLRLDRIDFATLTRAFTPFSLSGSVDGNFREIRVSQESLAAQGSLTIRTLGGQIEVSDIHGSSPFSRLRRMSMDVLLKNIDLEEASRSFEFGQMGGIIEGRVSDLAFSFGQPERFELEIHSVKKRGIKRYVNAQAVNSLSILSTGSAFPFKRGVLRFFESFPYAKLGIYCKLENDVFTLRGTIHQDGVEYLIRKGFFRGIDVINQNPENRIRWKQMLRRLKTIGQGKADVKISTQK